MRTQIRRTSRLVADVAFLLGVLCAGASGAWADKPTSHAEALAQGIPAATAPSFSEDVDGARYRGKPVSGETILDEELSCLAVDVGPDRCYDSPEALQAAELRPTAKAGRRKHPTARASACGIYEILFIWTRADFTGASAAFAERGRWANLRAEVDNQGSSFHMGDHSGHLAESQNGVGHWYPGNTGVCAYALNLNTNGLGWNNRITSRYRN
jgi:hypothetical protein